jgi:RHS repeat-associated protein
VEAYEPFAIGTADYTYYPPGVAIGKTIAQHDALGRPTRIDAPGPGHRTIEHGTAWETTTRDECFATGDCVDGRVFERRDALGRTIERQQYSGGSLKARTQFQYDAQNRLRRTTQGDLGGWNTNTTVETIYDTLGRRVELRDPDSGTWRYRYNRAGELILQDDPTADRHLEFCYDGMGRITKKQYVPSENYVGACGGNTQEQVTYQYTAALYGLGMPSQVSDQTGTTVFAAYSVRGEPMTVQRVMDGVTAETRYTYDSVGKVYSMLYPDSEAVVYEYNEVGQPSRLSSNQGPVYLQSSTYDIYGRPRVLTHGNGTIDTREYGGSADAYRLARIQATKPGGALFNYQYAEYTATGLLERLVDQGWTSPDPAAMKATATYTYDGLGRMLTATDVASRAYEYDDWGNIRRNDGLTLTYADPTRPHQATGFTGGGDIDHDANGNRELRSGGSIGDHDYVYDWDDRVRRVTVEGSDAVEFGYDAGGRRTIERRGPLDAQGALVNPEVTRFYSDVYQVTGATASKYYLAGGMLIASRRAAAPPALQVASGPSGPVQVAGYWANGPGLSIGLTPGAAAGVAAGAAALVGVFLLVPGRRRRLGLGWTFRPADAGLAVVVLLVTSLPVPLWVRPAGAQCEPQPTPTPVPIPPAEIHHYHLDHLGSAQTITDGNATILRQTRYHPYGQVRGRWLAAGDSEQDRREFTGYYSEPLSELDYAGARLYDPKLATFLTHDPAGQFASPYAYGPWSPQNGSDPSGAFWLLGGAVLTSEFLVTAAGIGFVAGFAAASIQAGVNGASVGDALVAGVNGGVAGAISAGVGLLFLQPALGAGLAIISEPARELAGPALFVSGLGQAAYGLSQDNYSGVIGLGVSIGVGFAMSQGADGALTQSDQLRMNASAFDQRFRIDGVVIGGAEALASTSATYDGPQLGVAQSSRIGRAARFECSFEGRESGDV